MPPLEATAHATSSRYLGLVTINRGRNFRACDFQSLLDITLDEGTIIQLIKEDE